MSLHPTVAAQPIASTEDFPATGQWFVLHTRSRQEKALADDLAARGVGRFLPLVKQVRTYGHRRMKVELPMFPGYIFLRGARDEAYVADRTRRVVQIIDVADQARLDWELRNIFDALSREVQFDPYPYLSRGTRVEVRSGPMRGLQGVVEDRVRPERLLLQVAMLGRAMSVEVDSAVLDPLD